MYVCVWVCMTVCLFVSVVVHVLFLLAIECSELNNDFALVSFKINIIYIHTYACMYVLN